MSDHPKTRTLGARKAPEQLSMSALVNFAERVIRTDKDAALRAQKSVSDLTAPSNDRSTAPRISSIQELCNKSGAVKVKSSDESNEDDEKIVDIASLRKNT